MSQWKSSNRTVQTDYLRIQKYRKNQAKQNNQEPEKQKALKIQKQEQQNNKDREIQEKAQNYKRIT